MGAVCRWHHRCAVQTCTHAEHRETTIDQACRQRSFVPACAVPPATYLQPCTELLVLVDIQLQDLYSLTKLLGNLHKQSTHRCVLGVSAAVLLLTGALGASY